MKIRVDQEGAKAIAGLLDLALKQGGVQNLDAVNIIRAGITVDEQPVIETADEDQGDVEQHMPFPMVK